MQEYRFLAMNDENHMAKLWKEWEYSQTSNTYAFHSKKHFHFVYIASKILFV